MKAKLNFGTDRAYFQDISTWVKIPCVPETGSRFLVTDFLSESDVSYIKANARCWSGDWGEVIWVLWRQKKGELYLEVDIQCEDS